MPRLGVNIDHVATLRQARGVIYPDPVTAAGLVELAGADGIVCHLREDRRHIQDRDLRLLREVVQTHLNLEMAATDEMIRIALATQPDIVTLVPEKREELTTEGGLDVTRSFHALQKAVRRLQKGGIPVSLFIDPRPDQIKASEEAGQIPSNSTPAFTAKPQLRERGTENSRRSSTRSERPLTAISGLRQVTVSIMPMSVVLPRSGRSKNSISVTVSLPGPFWWDWTAPSGR